MTSRSAPLPFRRLVTTLRLTRLVSGFQLPSIARPVATTNPSTGFNASTNNLRITSPPAEPRTSAAITMPPTTITKSRNRRSEDARQSEPTQAATFTATATFRSIGRHRREPRPNVSARTSSTGETAQRAMSVAAIPQNAKPRPRGPNRSARSNAKPKIRRVKAANGPLRNRTR